jgi:hypothetical protein
MKTKLSSLLLLTVFVVTLTSCNRPQLHRSSGIRVKTDDSTSILNSIELDKVIVSGSERQSWHEIIQWSDECENGRQSQEKLRQGDHGGLVFDKVDHGKYVVTVGCYVGPYWTSIEYFLLNNQPEPPQSEALTLDLVRIGNDGELVKYSTSNISGGHPLFDAETLTLTYIDKFRGLGGCGYYYRFKFIQDQFVLEEARYREVCDDTFPPLEEWAKIY